MHLFPAVLPFHPCPQCFLSWMGPSAIWQLSEPDLSQEKEPWPFSRPTPLLKLSALPSSYWEDFHPEEHSTQ